MKAKSLANPDKARSSASLAGGVGFLQQLVEEIPWVHHLLLLDKVKGATAQLGWSRNVLLNQSKAGAYEGAVTEKSTHNFPAVLPEYLAEQAGEAV